MSGMCEGLVAVVTGGGRGIGREYALMLASEGAKVVVNDLGGKRDGTGADISAAQEVVDKINAMGGEAAVNGADVSDWDASRDFDDPHQWLGSHFTDEAMQRGVYLHPWHNMFLSTAHTDDDIDAALERTDEAFAAVARAGDRARER